MTKKFLETNNPEEMAIFADGFVEYLRTQKVESTLKVIFEMLREREETSLDDKQLFQIINNEDASMRIAYKIIEQVTFLLESLADRYNRENHV